MCGTHLTTIVGPLFGIAVSSWQIYVNPYAAYRAIGDVPRLGLYLFVMYASGDAMWRFGLRKVRWRADLIALALALVVVGLNCAYQFLRSPAPENVQLWHMYAGRIAPLWLIAIVCILTGAYEEVAFRGYLIPRLEELSGSTPLAVIAQALFFGLVHSYRGFGSMVTAALFGLLLGFIFTK